ncbi:MAG: PCMD domain-containing protein [Prevotellaceae bacterium]|jgi:hypothetical protein|nr:PCMD domain-containing protein [Prevotellaceae bacterium]
MTKKHFHLVALFGIVATLFTFTACDEDDPIKFPIDEELAGTYKGQIETTVGTETMKLPVNIIIGKVDDTHVSLTLKNFSFGEMNLGDIAVSSCKVAAPEAKESSHMVYPISGSETVKLNAVGDCNVVVAGTVGKEAAALELDVDVPAIGTIKVNFNGTRLKGGEKTEAKILSVKLTDKDNIVTEGPNIITEGQGIGGNIGGAITFKVREDATEAQIKALKAEFTASEGAMVILPEGDVPDFSEGGIIVMVVSEDGATVTTYAMGIAGKQAQLKYSFDEEWEEVYYGKDVDNNPIYYPNPQPTNELSTSNGGTVIMYPMVEYPVMREEAGYAGAAVKLVTRDARAVPFVGTMAPLTAGTLFTGSFELKIMTPLKSTQFGLPYTKKPVSFKGYYKFAPGATFIEKNKTTNKIEEVPDKVDVPTIMAVLYEAETEKITLDGTNIEGPAKEGDPDLRVAIASLADGSAKAEWTAFDLPFVFLEGKSYDPTKSYKLAIVCASSKDGAKFSGAPDSTLWVDELEVVGESPEAAE